MIFVVIDPTVDTCGGVREQIGEILGVPGSEVILFYVQESMKYPLDDSTRIAETPLEQCSLLYCCPISEFSTVDPCGV
jgi:hypothetical protein